MKSNLIFNILLSISLDLVFIVISSGAILTVTWDEERKWLFSGSADQSVIIWDIGGQKGSAVELHGHKYDCFPTVRNL